jgi:3'-5' exoribonuclease
MNFKPVGATGKVEGFCLVKRCEVKTSMKGAKYMDLVLADKTGEISGKYWDYQEGVSLLFQENDLVKIRGTMDSFRGAPQLRIELIRPALPSDNVDPADYVATAGYDSEAMYQAILSVADSFRDEDLKNLLKAVYEKYKEKLLYYPAAVRLHHAMRGGLLYHTLSIMRMAQKASTVYPKIDADLLLCGAALHDIGKLEEMDAGELGIAGKYTVDGNLLGHLVRGTLMVNDVAEEIGTPPEKTELILHMLISHHGQPEFGSAVRPMFLEAHVLSLLDELDAKVYEITDLVSQVEPGEFTQRIWSLDDTRLYNPGRVEDMHPEAVLLEETAPAKDALSEDASHE